MSRPDKRESGTTEVYLRPRRGGGSHLRFEESGRVSFHVDSWDVGAAVYEGVPVLGALVRAVRRKL